MSDWSDATGATPIYNDFTGDLIGYRDSAGNYYNPDGTPQSGTISPGTIFSPPIGAAPVTQTTVPSNVSASTTDWVKMFTDAAPKIITGLQAWQLSQINVDRAQRGLPPLNAALYAPGQAGFMANMSSTGMLLIAGVVALVLLSGRR